MKNKTTPSQDTRHAWLAGIIDGEGTIALYKTNQGNTIYGVVIVNTDEGILAKIQDIYESMDVYFSRIKRASYAHPTSYNQVKPCYEIVVRRKADTRVVLTYVLPFLSGVKYERALRCIEAIDLPPKPRPSRKRFYTCKRCGISFHRPRKRVFCSQTCWHNYATGELNPNFRHGRRISGVTTERETPVMDEATV